MAGKDMNTFLRDTRGVSVIFATLLLILITIIAASGVAFMVSTMQKDAMDRESHQAAVKSEELRIVSIKPSGNGTAWQSIDMTVLNLNTANSYISSIKLNDAYFLNFKAYDASGNRDVYRDYPAVYNAKNRVMIPATKARTIHLNFSDIVVTGSETIPAITGWTNNSENYTYRLKMHPWKAYYGEFFTYEVIDTNNSTVCLPLNNFTIFNESQTITFLGNDSGGSLSNTTDYEISYTIDFRSYFGVPPLEKEPLHVEMITSYINIFKGLFTPPMPIANIQFRVEYLMDTNGTQYPRSYMILDASDSRDNDGFITSYKWALWNDNGNEVLYDYNLSGMVVRPMIDPYNHHNVTIDLMVTDDRGMTAKLSQVSGNLTVLS
jgi:hypothetical protein